MLTASSSSMMDVSAVTRLFSKRKREQNLCRLPTYTSFTPSSSMVLARRSLMPRAARLVKVRHSMSA